MKSLISNLASALIMLACGLPIGGFIIGLTNLKQAMGMSAAQRACNPVAFEDAGMLLLFSCLAIGAGLLAADYKGRLLGIAHTATLALEAEEANQLRRDAFNSLDDREQQLVLAIHYHRQAKKRAGMLNPGAVYLTPQHLGYSQDEFWNDEPDYDNMAQEMRDREYYSQSNRP